MTQREELSRTAHKANTKEANIMAGRYLKWTHKQTARSANREPEGQISLPCRGLQDIDAGRSLDGDRVLYL